MISQFSTIFSKLKDAGTKCFTSDKRLSGHSNGIEDLI